MKLTGVRGIYAIENTVNGKRYIGSATNLAARRAWHMNALRRGAHHSVLLQRSYDKHGESVFSFKVLLLCDKENQIFFEQRMIDGFKSSDPAFGYNVAKNAEAPYGTCTPESMAKRSVAQREKAKKYAFRGEMLCLVEISERINMPFRLLMSRVQDRGWDIEKAATHKRRNPNGKRWVKKNTPRKDGTPRRNRAQKFEHDGLSMTAAGWARHLGCNYSVLSRRLNSGMSIAEAMAIPIVNNIKLITYNGKTQSMTQWANEVGIAQQTLQNRLGRLGWPIERALTAKPQFYHHDK